MIVLKKHVLDNAADIKWLFLRSVRSIGAACAIFLLGSVSAFAAGVQPMVFELAPSGSDARTVLTVFNDGSVPLSIEAVPHRITMDKQGKETRFPGDDDLLLFPPVALIQAGSSQTIQVQYVGDPEISHSMPYRISIMQLPVDTGETRGMKVSANFHTLLNVVPVNAKAELEVISIERQTEDGKWSLEISNTGNRFARLSRTSWLVSAGGRSVELNPLDVAQRAESNLILPNTSRSVIFNPPEGFDFASTSIAIDAGT